MRLCGGAGSPAKQTAPNVRVPSVASCPGEGWQRRGPRTLAAPASRRGLLEASGASCDSNAARSGYALHLPPSGHIARAWSLE